MQYMDKQKYTDGELDLLVEAVWARCDAHPETKHPRVKERESDRSDLWLELVEGLELMSRRPEYASRQRELEDLIVKVCRLEQLHNHLT